MKRDMNEPPKLPRNEEVVESDAKIAEVSLILRFTCHPSKV
jgi:hypothetical protein